MVPGHVLRPLGVWGPFFDPKAVYDPDGERFIVAACAGDYQAVSTILLAVSDSSDPTGSWYFFKIDSDPANQVWADYPGLGFNKQWLVITTNMYNDAGDFQWVNLRVIGKEAAYAGAVDRVTTITPAENAELVDAFTLSPAETYDSDEESLFLTEHDYADPGTVRLWQLSGVVGAETVTMVRSVHATETAWSTETTCSGAPQEGSSDLVCTGGGRMMNTVVRNGSIWAVHTVYTPAESPAHSAIHWIQLDPVGDIVDHGVIGEEDPANWYSYPSIAVNAAGDVRVGYSRTSATSYVGAYNSYRGLQDPDSDALVYAAEGLPEGASFDPDSHTLAFVPDYEQAGNHSIEFSATDGVAAGILEVEVEVTQTNRVPEVEPVAPMYVVSGSHLEWTITASDPDGDTLTYGADNLPDGAVLDETSGMFGWTPTGEQNGMHEVAVWASDGTDTETITVDIYVELAPEGDSGWGCRAGGRTRSDVTIVLLILLTGLTCRARSIRSRSWRSDDPKAGT